MKGNSVAAGQRVRPAPRQASRRAMPYGRVVLGLALALVIMAAVIFAYTARAELLVVALIAVPAVLYWASLRLHPYVTCKKCGGSGAVSGRLFKQSRAFCDPCGGTGLVPRFGTRFLPAGHRPPDRKGAMR